MMDITYGYEENIENKELISSEGSNRKIQFQNGMTEI